MPEDAANGEIARGFGEHLAVNGLRIDVLGPGGGWEKVAEAAISDAKELRRYPARYLVLLIDSDGQADRIGTILQRIPEDIAERVFVVSSLWDAESLRSAIKMKFAQIGEALASDCTENEMTHWMHDHLRHNEGEVQRLRLAVKHFLFVQP